MRDEEVPDFYKVSTPMAMGGTTHGYFPVRKVGNNIWDTSKVDARGRTRHVLKEVLGAREAEGNYPGGSKGTEELYSSGSPDLVLHYSSLPSRKPQTYSYVPNPRAVAVDSNSPAMQLPNFGLPPPTPEASQMPQEQLEAPNAPLEESQ